MKPLILQRTVYGNISFVNCVLLLLLLQQLRDTVRLSSQLVRCLNFYETCVRCC